MGRRYHNSYGGDYQWNIVEAGDGKVFLQSFETWKGKKHQDQYLSNKNDKLSLARHASPKIWDQWSVKSAGDGKVFISSHRSEKLQDDNGALRLSRKSRDWEKWYITRQDGTSACTHSRNPPAPATPVSQQHPTTDAASSADARWVMNSTCDDARASGMSCSEICLAHGRSCMPDLLHSLRGEAALGQIALSMGRSCEDFTDHPGIHGHWDGPWIAAHPTVVCGYTSNPDWEATCEMRPSCGFDRVCPCTLTAVTR